MDEREELRQELQWVIYRQKMLDVIEEKLLEMEQIAELAKEGNLSKAALEVVTDRLNALAAQVRALDSESRKNDNEKILE